VTVTIEDSQTAFSRLNFFPRQLITADDLNQEQRYHREKLREHNRFLHGWGVVCGCDVQLVGDDTAAASQVRICPGYVVTPQGDTVWIRSDAVFDVATCFVQSRDPCALARPCPPVAFRTIVENTLYLAVRYAECKSRPVRVAPHGCSCDDAECEYSRIVDAYEFCCLTALPDTHAREDDCGKLFDRRRIVPCPECPDDPWVVLATLTISDAKPVAVTAIDAFADRHTLVSVAQIQEMALCASNGIAAPWHSSGGSVFHNNRLCTVGNNIEAENYREGTGNKPLCKECARLSRRGRSRPPS
jgi:hypothetical protein